LQLEEITAALGEVLKEVEVFTRTIPTFPHHKHVGNEVRAAKEKLPDILALIRERLR